MLKIYEWAQLEEEPVTLRGSLLPAPGGGLMGAAGSAGSGWARGGEGQRSVPGVPRSPHG